MESQEFKSWTYQIDAELSTRAILSKKAVLHKHIVANWSLTNSLNN